MNSGSLASDIYAFGRLCARLVRGMEGREDENVKRFEHGFASQAQGPMDQTDLNLPAFAGNLRMWKIIPPPVRTFFGPRQPPPIFILARDLIQTSGSTATILDLPLDYKEPKS